MESIRIMTISRKKDSFTVGPTSQNAKIGREILFAMTIAKFLLWQLWESSRKARSNSIKGESDFRFY